MKLYKKICLLTVSLITTTNVFAIDYCENGYRMNDIHPTSSVVKNIKIDTNNNVPSSWRDALELTILELNNKFNHIDVGILIGISKRWFTGYIYFLGIILGFRLTIKWFRISLCRSSYL